MDRVPELSVTIVGTQGHVQGQDSGTRLCRVPELGVERYTIFLTIRYCSINPQYDNMCFSRIQYYDMYHKYRIVFYDIITI